MTGASSGIGAALARRLADRVMNLSQLIPHSLVSPVVGRVYRRLY